MINFIVSFFMLFKFVSNNQHISPESVDNFYQENDKIIAVIDDIFIKLNINKNFKKFKTVAEYMSIYRYIQDEVENRNKKYNEIYNLTKITPCYKAAYYVSNINKAVGEMISEHKEKNTDMFFNNNKYFSPAISDDTLTDFVNLAKQLRFNLNVDKNYKDTKYYDIAKNVDTRRIFLGVQAEIRDWPFVVSIHIAGKFICAGSIIREDLVLSAGSCFRKFYKNKLKQEFKSNIWIRAGSDCLNSGGVTVRVVMLHFYPKFNPVERSNNIVVVQLKSKLKFKNQLIQPIKFAKQRTKYTGVDILGWGNKEYESMSVPDSPEFVKMNQQPSMERRDRRKMYDVDMNIENRRLQRAVLNRYSMIDCISVYPDHTITSRNFCAGSSHQGSGACKYDLGGPGVIGIELHGVISFGLSRCGTRAAPTVFTKVYRYARWLDKLFCKIPLTNDTVDDSGQMDAMVKLGPNKENVLYTDESYILNEINKDIQAGYRNLSDLYLPIKEDHVQMLLRESNQDNPFPNNIYLDPTLVNSTEVFEKLKVEESVKTEPGDETDQVSNWVLYKEFMAQILNNKSNDLATDAFGVTKGNFAQSTAAETISLLSEMQEEYDAESSEQKVEFEHNEAKYNVPNNDDRKTLAKVDTPNIPIKDKEESQTQNIEFEYKDIPNASNNDENKVYIQNNSPNDSKNDKEKLQTQNVEFEYEDIPNAPNNDEEKAQLLNDSANDPNNDIDKPQTQNVEFEYEDTPNNDENKSQVQKNSFNYPNYDKDKLLTQNVQFEYEDIPNNNDPVNTKLDANDLAEIIISDSGTTQKLLLNKKDPDAVNRFVNELSKLKDKIARTSTTIFYREADKTEKWRQ